MTVVVDASVALKWFVREELSDEAFRLLHSGEELVAPELIVVEVTNIAWKKLVRNQISSGQAATIATGIGQSDIRLLPSATFNERALEMAETLNHPVYDCLYLACAESSDAAVITADQRFYRAATNGGFARNVALLHTRRTSTPP